MRKTVVMVLVVALLAAVLRFTPVSPVRAAVGAVVQIAIGSTKATINSKQVVLDQPPIIENGRTLVPFRFIGDAIGAKIGWDSKKKEVSYVFGDMNIVLTIGSTTAIVNGKKTTLDVAPKILSGRTMVPVRFISEALGAKVDWDGKTRMVTITLGGKVAQAVTVRITGWGGTDTTIVEGLINEVVNPKLAGTGIKVDYEPVENDYQKVLLNELSAGTAPDLFYVDVNWAEPLMAAGELEPLDNYLVKSTVLKKDDIIPSLLSGFTYNGKVYGIPKDFNTLSLIYNKDLFNIAGVPYPNENDTWNDLEPNLSDSPNFSRVFL